MKAKAIWVLLFIIISVIHSLAQPRTLVPDNFAVPDSLVTADFILRPLSVKYTEKDYAAVMQSLDHLKGVFGPKSDWPQPTLTLADDQWDLEWHEKEFAKRTSFTYTVLNTDETEVIGCVYIYPASKRDYEVEIAMWVSQSSFDKGLDKILFRTVKNWVTKAWPFKAVAYPGREISWEQWLSK